MTSFSPLATLNVSEALFGSLCRVPAQHRHGNPAEQMAEVREFAFRLRRSEPGFAADLLAAADRREFGAGRL
jgi:hypothetical protein